MPQDNNKDRSKASKRPYKSEDDKDTKKQKHTENNDTGSTGTAKDSEASTSTSTRKNSNKDCGKTTAYSRLQKLRNRIKKDVFKIGNKDSSETSQSQGGNLKRPRMTTEDDPKQTSKSPRYQVKDSKNISKNVGNQVENIPKRMHSSRRSSNEIIIINSSTESVENSPKKMCLPKNISGKPVPDSKSKHIVKQRKSLETPPDQKNNTDKTTSQSPMNQRMSRIRKTSSNSGNVKNKILNVSEKILAGEIDNIVATPSAKTFKIPLKKKQSQTPTSDSTKDMATSGDSEEKREHFIENSKESISLAFQKETNIFATNNNDKGSPNKMQCLMKTPNPASTPNTNIFASKNQKNLMDSLTPRLVSTNSTNIIASDIKSPEFKFESKRSSSPNVNMQSKNSNIFATEALRDINETNSDIDCSLEIIEEITSPCGIETPINHKSSTRIVGNKSNSMGDRMKKIRGQLLQTTEKEADKSVDNDFGFVSQMSSDELLYKNPQPCCSRANVVQDWMDSIHPTPNLTDQSASDSMLVNFDNTLLEKSEILAVSQEDNSMEWDSIPDVPPSRFPNDSSSIEETQKEKYICVVADTNIFMNDLNVVDTILNLKLPGDKKLIIYVPWMVLGELDNLKEARSNIFKTFATQKALNGQRFINKHLAQSNSKIICQSVNEVCQQLDLGKSPDDKILACCLQVQNKYETVILLTGDINLRNKALANQVKSYPPSEIVERLENSKFFKIKVLSQEVLSDIISRCCWNVYGQAIHQMNALQVGRWRFEDCIARFKQYWRPVFSQLLLKHCLKTVEELGKLSQKGKEIETNPKEFMNFVNRVKELLFYLQDIEYFNSIVRQLRDNIDEIVKAPKEF